MEWISNAKCGQELNTGTIFNAKKFRYPTNLARDRG